MINYIKPISGLKVSQLNSITYLIWKPFRWGLIPPKLIFEYNKNQKAVWIKNTGEWLTISFNSFMVEFLIIGILLIIKTEILTITTLILSILNVILMIVFNFWNTKYVRNKVLSTLN